MTLSQALTSITQYTLPNQIIFNLNEDKSTFTLDCMFNTIKINGEDRSMILHSDKTNFPKDTELYIVKRDKEKIWFDIIIPDEEKENTQMEGKTMGTIHIQTSNGRNCTKCNKSNVCKYKDTVEDHVKMLISTLEKQELPLSVNINCREWSGELELKRSF